MCFTFLPFYLLSFKKISIFAHRLTNPDNEKNRFNIDNVLRHSYGDGTGLSGARFGAAREDADGAIRTHVAVVGDASDTRVVPRCVVRYLGTLGAAMRGGFRRLDGPRYVY